MPQVFSAGWLYLFFLAMAVGTIYILVKLREVHREQDPDTPVIKVAPMAPAAPRPEGDEKGQEVLREADSLIKEGRFLEAVDLLTPAVQRLSPVDDREALGKIQYRIGACQRRLGWKENKVKNLLRSGEALKEAVSHFAPHRLRSLRLAALGELAGLYEDLARHQNPAGNLGAAQRTWDAAARTAKMSAQPSREALFLSRAGDLFRRLALISSRGRNLAKALETYEKALNVPGAFSEPDSLLEKARVLKNIGDLRVELKGIREEETDSEEAIRAYEEALMILSPEKQTGERGQTLLCAGRVLLGTYRNQGGNSHLGKSLKYLGEAVNLLGSEKSPSGKGCAMALLGEGLICFAELKGQKDYRDKGIRLCKAALGFLKEPEFADECDRIREELRKTEKMGEVSESGN